MVSRARVAYGVLGAATALAAAGVAGAGVVIQRRRPSSRGDEPRRFDDLEPDRVTTVQTDDGVTLHVEETGPADAPLTVVFSHGFSLSLRSFYFQRRAVQEKFGDAVRLVAYDQRGHGQSGPTVPEGATIDQLGRDLLGVLDAVVPDGPIVLVGHSMGGMSVLSLAQLHPQLFASPARRGDTARVAGVALINTSTGGLGQVSLGLPALISRLRGPLAPVLLRTARRRAAFVERSRRIGGDLAWVITRRLSFGSPGVGPEVVDFLHDIISATRIEVIADFYPDLMAYDVSAGVPVLAATAGLVVTGEKDTLTPVEHGRRISADWPAATYVELDGCGHVAILEEPDAVDAALIDLVDRVAQALPGRRRWR